MVDSEMDDDVDDEGLGSRGHPGSGRKNRRKVVSNPSSRGGRGITHHHHSVEDRT